MRICFLGVENMTAEDLADIQAALYERINQRILNSGAFRPVSKRYVDAGLKAAKLRPVDVLYPQNMRILADHMEQIWQPFEFVLIAKLTSSPTRSNANNETEYLLTLEMVNLHNDQYAKESTTIVKTHASTWAKLNSLTPWG